MKKINALLLALLIAATVACKKKEDETKDPVTEPGTIELSGSLSTMTLDASKKYLLIGTVYVPSGADLTIPAGTVILGDKATKGTLVVSPGGQIFANGTSTSPVVFTSEAPIGERDRGDWGGLLILGNAQVNNATNNTTGRPTVEGIDPAAYFGNTGTDFNTESSGTLQYVRIEFAGIALFPNVETNGLTMAGVGSGTVIDHVMVSYGGDDAFEWFGGTVNASYLVAHANWDDDMDCDNGFVGKVQHVLVVRDHSAADQSTSNGFEVDNNASGSTAAPITAPKFSNVTFYGPRSDSATTLNANYGRAMHLRRSSQITIINSVFTGYNTGLLMDGANTTATLKNNVLALTKTATAGTAPTFTTTASSGVVPSNWATDNVETTVLSSNVATKLANWSAVGLTNASFFAETQPYPANPSFEVSTGTISAGADFTGFTADFTSTTHRGAFGSTDWTDVWTVFNPINTAY